MSHTLQQGIDLFNRCAFFECHEALEQIWTPERGPRRLFLQSLIHIAVAFYQVQRDNRVGAERQLQKGLRKLAPYLPAYEGVDTQILYSETSECLALIQSGQALREFPKIRLN